MTSPKKAASQTALPAGLGKPAVRAFAAAGYTRLEDFATAKEAELARLHGVGPKALRVLREALAARGLSFAEPA
jgi:predicted flap endonuclease-1-like 5' DNA nuclease